MIQASSCCSRRAVTSSGSALRHKSISLSLAGVQRCSTPSSSSNLRLTGNSSSNYYIHTSSSTFSSGIGSRNIRMRSPIVCSSVRVQSQQLQAYANNYNQQCCRTYLFLPSDWSEIKFRCGQWIRQNIFMIDTKSRTVHVKLIKKLQLKESDTKKYYLNKKNYMKDTSKRAAKKVAEYYRKIKKYSSSSSYYKLSSSTPNNARLWVQHQRKQYKAQYKRYKGILLFKAQQQKIKAIRAQARIRRRLPGFRSITNTHNHKKKKNRNNNTNTSDSNYALPFGVDEHSFIPVSITDVVRSNKPGRGQRFVEAAMKRISSKGTPYYSKFSMNTLNNKIKRSSNSKFHLTNIITKPIQLTEYSKEEWFHPIDGRPLASKDPSGRFVNPWLSQSTNGVHSLTNILLWRYQRFLRNINQHGMWAFLPSIDLSTWNTSIPQLTQQQQQQKHQRQQTAKHREHLDKINTVKTFDNTSSVDENQSSSEVKSHQTSNKNNNNDNIQFTWIGHSTCLLHMSGTTILTDPMFSHRASPYQSLPVGVSRDIPPAYDIHELKDLVAKTIKTKDKVSSSINEENKSKSSSPPPPIDICLISHDHYDHCDVQSIQKLYEQKLVNCFIVPLGLKEWFISKCRLPEEYVNNNVIEVEWWESINFYNKLLITCCPAQHWCGRTFWDRNKRLWCSFAVHTIHNKNSNSSDIQEDDGNVKVNTSTNSPSFYFAGDSGVPIDHEQESSDIHQRKQTPFPLFEQIGNYLGPFDLAAIPIGAYEPNFLMQDAHMNPKEAVFVHNAIKAKKSVAIHYGTFALSEEPHTHPPQWLHEIVTEHNENLLKSKKNKTTSDNSSNLKNNNDSTTSQIESKFLDFVTLPHGGTIEVDCSSSAISTPKTPTVTNENAKEWQKEKEEHGEEEEEEEVVEENRQSYG